jgi:hypothetical protein
MMMQPLCPALYERLQAQFGHVRVANEGQAFEGRYVRELFTRRTRLIIEVKGETYCVACPFCGDDRSRLWVNHRWPNIPLIKCFHKNCLQQPALRQRFRLMVFGSFDPRPLAIAPGWQKSSEARVIELPDRLRPLTDLHLCHPARTHLEDRGFDPDELARLYGLTYCHEYSRSSLARGRMVIPVMMHGRLVGWQARLVVEPPPDVKVPKYVTAPGMQKSTLLFNLDRAQESATVVLVEGVSDVWRVGPQAVALLGHELSAV